MSEEHDKTMMILRSHILTSSQNLPPALLQMFVLTPCRACDIHQTISRAVAALPCFAVLVAADDMPQSMNEMNQSAASFLQYWRNHSPQPAGSLWRYTVQFFGRRVKMVCTECFEVK